MRFAIVDIETTGGKSDYHRIIEIAVFLIDNQEIIDSFNTLVNPERPIPGFITSLTGIDSPMVENAPTFDEISQELLAYLEGAVFVAHNVNFDLGFIRHEFKRVNISYNPKKLCTVRLSRKLLAGLPSYSLGNLCNSLGISLENRHRAFGDAAATTTLFQKLLLADNKGVIEKSLMANSREATLPPYLERWVFEALPDSDGVYYFLDKRSEVLYVGKARNIKKRVGEHFSSGSKTRSIRALWENIHHISYELCGNELVSLILETHEIKRLWPRYNRANKIVRFSHGLFQYEDQNGFIRLALNPLKGHYVKPAQQYSSLADGKLALSKMIKEYQLCPALCGYGKTAAGCFEYILGNCRGACLQHKQSEAYNMRVAEALVSSEAEKDLLIVGNGRTATEKSVLWLEEGKLNGYGYVDENESYNSLETLKEYVKPIKYYPEYSYIINGFLNRKPSGYQFITL